ncbi:MAG: response regulator transcription factor [Anaerolineae bacterium]|nr:response regulator transcription factor [Anaerolineae bacterium]
MYALLVADDADEGAVLSLVLQRAGLAVTSARDLEQAMESWPERPADVILLALTHPIPLAQVHRVRSVTEAPLVLIVSPVGEETHYALLETGADLVVSRPFSARLLIAQVRALLRRAGGVPLVTLPTLSIGDLTLDPATRTVKVAQRPPQRLTHLEFRLLYTLMIHRDQVLPTQTIVERVWGYTGEGDRELVRGLISRLRAKIESDPRQPRTIVTSPGVGYVFRTGADR